jgi:hypothetical protein
MTDTFRQMNSLTLTCQIIVCYDGHHNFIFRRLSTCRLSEGYDGPSTMSFFEPTCSRRCRAKIDLDVGALATLNDTTWLIEL